MKNRWSASLGVLSEDRSWSTTHTVKRYRNAAGILKEDMVALLMIIRF